MRRLLLEIEVDCEGGAPRELRYRHRRRRVARALDAWRYGGRWWRFEPARSYWLLELEGDLEAEVFREDLTERWVLSRVTD